MFLVTITERTPTEDGTDVNSYHVIKKDMFEVSTFLEEQELSWTVWVNVSITYIKEL